MVFTAELFHRSAHIHSLAGVHSRGAWVEEGREEWHRRWNDYNHYPSTGWLLLLLFSTCLSTSFVPVNFLPWSHFFCLLTDTLVPRQQVSVSTCHTVDFVFSFSRTATLYNIIFLSIFLFPDSINAFRETVNKLVCHECSLIFESTVGFQNVGFILSLVAHVVKQKM